MLKDDIQQFLSELAISKSPETVSSYQCGLVSYVKLYGEFTVENVMGFATWLHQNRSIATLHLYLTAIARFAKWLKKTKKMSAGDYADLVERLEDVRGGRHGLDLPKVPLEADVQKVAGAANQAYNTKDTSLQQLKALRDIALLHFLRSTGCRVSEVADIHRNALRPDERAAVVTGKGRKQRIVYFDDSAWDAITVYLAARDATGVGGLPDEPVFCRYDRQASGRVLAISPNVIRCMINKLEKVGETLYHLHPHLWRHRFGTLTLQQLHDLAAVQKMLGHESPKTTEVYAHYDNEQIRTAHHKCNL